VNLLEVLAGLCAAIALCSMMVGCARWGERDDQERYPRLPGWDWINSRRK
jgi:hypothetical protein